MEQTEFSTFHSKWSNTFWFPLTFVCPRGAYLGSKRVWILQFWSFWVVFVQLPIYTLATSGQFLTTSWQFKPQVVPPELNQLYQLEKSFSGEAVEVSRWVKSAGSNAWRIVAKPKIENNTMTWLIHTYAYFFSHVCTPRIMRTFMVCFCFC